MFLKVKNDVVEPFATKEVQANHAFIDVQMCPASIADLR